MITVVAIPSGLLALKVNQHWWITCSHVHTTVLPIHFQTGRIIYRNMCFKLQDRVDTSNPMILYYDLHAGRLGYMLKHACCWILVSGKKLLFVRLLYLYELQHNANILHTVYSYIVSFLRNDSFAKWCIATNFSTESENFNKLSRTLGDKYFQ